MFCCHFFMWQPRESRGITNDTVTSYGMLSLFKNNGLRLKWSFKYNAKNKNTRAKMALLPCMPCGRVRGTDSLGKHENGSVSVPLNLKVAD